MPLLRVRIFVIRIIRETTDAPGIGGRQGSCEALPLNLNDVEGCAVGEIGSRVSVARKRRSIRPNCRFKIVLSVLAPSRQWIPIQTIARPDYRLWIQRPGHTDPVPPVILDGWRRKEFSSCYHYVPKMRIVFKCIRDTWC